jgi:hypothetical protein
MYNCHIRWTQELLHKYTVSVWSWQSMLWGESVAYYVHFSCIFHLPVKYLNQRCKNIQILPNTQYCLSGIWSTEETTLKMDPQITHAFGIHVTQHRNNTYLQLHCHYLLWCYSFLYQNTRSYKKCSMIAWYLMFQLLANMKTRWIWCC